MSGNISNNPNSINPNLNTEAIKKTYTHGHHKQINTQDNNATQKPDVVSGATKKSGGDHYFETKA
jgi:hypothetical protein